MTDPKIKYDIEANVNGASSVEDLEKHLRDLGGALEGDLKVQAIAAADAIKSLGEKQAAVANFQALKNEAGALAIELAQAESDVQQLDLQLSKVSGTTQQFVRAELDAKAALESKKAQLSAARKAYEDLQAGTLGAARKTDEYRQSSESARTAIQGLAAEVKQNSRSLKEAEAGTKAAQQAENALAAQHQKTSAALIQMRGAVQDNNAALSTGSDRLKSMGIEATNLAQAERNLTAATAAVRQEALGLVPAFAQVTKASNDAAQAQDKNSRSMREGLTSISSQLQNIQNIATVALGGGFATGLLKDVADTADAFNNLAARVKLSTGEGKAFEEGFSRVQQVALATHSALEGTGILFARILQAGKEFNLTQQQALGLTQTINQAVQLSGASAASSDAAITQLIQGLQSGVLRGEEFNSVMEQAPRLAKALADGLGVTTGELRKMSQAGELSAKTVITALQSQSAALQTEFGQLPATVGRAITDLQTQWTLFVGKLDSSTGVTSYVAEGINKLAGNLETVARVAGLAGAALTASLAVQGAAALRAYAAEAALAAGATNLLTASIEKVPKAINIVVAVTGFEIGYQIGTMLYDNSELARKLGAGIVGYFEIVVNGLRLAKEAAAAVFTRDTVDAAFDRFMERNRLVRDNIQAMMVDAEQAPTKVGAAVDAASDKMQGLGGAAQAAGTQAAAAGAAGAVGVAAMGKATADTLSIFKELLTEAQKPPAKQGAVESIALQLVEARKKGLDLDALLRSELPDAISKLSGADLAKFRQEFTKAMQDAGASGKELQTGLRLIGEQAARSLGVDLAAAGQQVTRAFKESDEAVRMLILSMPALKEAGVDAGRVVGQALSKMLDSAKNQAEIDAIRARIAALRNDLGEPLANGLLDQAKQKAEDLKDALDAATPGINSVREAMKQLGITSDESLRQTAATAKEAYDTLTTSGKASVRELAEGFKKAAEAAIAANNGVAPAWVSASAAMRGFEIEVDKAGKSTLRLRDATDQAAGAHGRAARATRDQATELERLNAVREREIAAQERANQLKEREIALYLKKWNMDSQHRSLDADGKVREETGLPTRKGIFDRAKNAGLSEEEAIALADSFDLNSLKDTGSRGTPFINMQRLDDAIAEAVLAAARRKAQGGDTSSSGSTESTETGGSGRQNRGANPGRSAGGASGVSANGAPGITRVVNLNIGTGGRAYTVPTNAQGEQNLRAMAQGFMAVLADGKSVSGIR